MEMTKREFLATGVGVGVGLAGAALPTLAQEAGGAVAPRITTAARAQAYTWSGKQPASVDLNYKPRRLNKVIELFEDDQPIYYVSYAPATGDGYETGLKMAKTWADCICVEIEQGCFDMDWLHSRKIRHRAGRASAGPAAQRQMSQRPGCVF